MGDLTLPKLAAMTSSPLLPSSEATKAAVRMATRSLDASSSDNDESAEAPSVVAASRSSSSDQDSSDDNSTFSSIQSDSPTIYAGNLSPSLGQRRSLRSKRSLLAVDDDIDDEIASVQTKEVLDSPYEVASSGGAVCGFMDCTEAMVDLFGDDDNMEEITAESSFVRL